LASNRRTPRPNDDLVDWFTVSYRSIYTAVGIVLAAAGGYGYYYYVKNAPPPLPPSETVITQPTAHFSGIEGTVKVKAVGTFEWITADSSIALKKSDIVRTGPGSAAEIRFFDGTVVAVGADSLIMIEASSSDPQSRKSKVGWRVSNGKVEFQVPPRGAAGGEAEISTPTVTARTETAATGAISVEQSGERDVRVYGGQVVAKTKTGDTIELTQNEGVRIDQSGKAGPEVKLPGVPVLLSPANQSEVAYPDPTRAITLLAWKPVAEAVSYQVLLDYSPHFNRPLVDRGGIKESSVEVRGLDTGKYYWRVAAVDGNGVTGKFSDFSRFAVARPTGASQGDGPPPPLTIDTLDVRANILQIKGRTEPGATVTVNGQRVDVQSDGSFNEFIQLAKLGRQFVVVKAVGINGGENEQRRPVLVAD
jgi:FecR-like protein/glucodextranase-like protein